MNDRPAARGIDDDGIDVDPGGLGAPRLRILERDRLPARGHELATGTDTEVLVHPYEDFRDELVHSFEGVFAFALWDAKRRRPLLARDRFGEKPPSYAEHAGDLTLASELDALAGGTRLRPDLDPPGDSSTLLRATPTRLPQSVDRRTGSFHHRLLWFDVSVEKRLLAATPLCVFPTRPRWTSQ